MKYGEQFVNESVPQWSLYNIDYNSLKHHIKVHTTKDQASAIAIPGQQDTALTKFEDELYTELCRQHDRVDLFVKSKADELARRMHHLSDQIHRLVLRSITSGRGPMSLKRQRRFARYDRDLVQCGEEIQALQRFVKAQVVAFRKILKKYKKWTGSSTLGARFRDTILSDPKSFTRQDLSQLQGQYDDLLEALRANSSTDGSGIVSPGTPRPSFPGQPANQLSPSDTIVVAHHSPALPAEVQTGYWNEYDCGSEVGDTDLTGDGYAIYINPNEDIGFPGMATLRELFKTPVVKWRAWTGNGPPRGSEQGGLLPQHHSTYGATDASYFAPVPGQPWHLGDSDDADDDETDRPGSGPLGEGRRGSYGYASSLEGFPSGYKAHYAALPSIEEQRVAQYRDRVYFWGTWACYLVSFALMGIALILITTGRHKKRLEVDAGATLGIMASLSSACAALCMACSRPFRSAWIYRLAVWCTFITACMLNGMLLVLVVGNAPLLL